MTTESNRSSIYVLSSQLESRLYASWLDQLNRPWEFVGEYDANWQPPDNAAIVVTHHHYRLKEVSILQRLMQCNTVPVLVLADGILEYRNTFEHPQIAGGAVFQPLYGHKLACIGRSQARIVESWNKPGCCEVVGLPHLDEFPVPDAAIDGSETEAIQSSDSDLREFRILIASARKPGFTADQLRAVTAGFADLKTWLDKHPRFGNVSLVPVWRLTGDLADDLRLDPENDHLSTGDLKMELQNVDAVITTPSTLAIEAMRFDIPVALIDYTNSPHYLSAAWNIRATVHLESVIAELIAPPPAKQLFQRCSLFDSLECMSPASVRMVRLVSRMIEAGNASHARGESIQLPARILSAEDYAGESKPATISIDALFHNAPLVAYPDTTDLAVIAGHQQAETARILDYGLSVSMREQEAAKMRRVFSQTNDYFDFKRTLLARHVRFVTPRTMWFDRAQSEVLAIAAVNQWLRFVETRRENDSRKPMGRGAITPVDKPSGVIRFLRKLRSGEVDNHRGRSRRVMNFDSTSYWRPRKRKVYFAPKI